MSVTNDPIVLARRREKLAKKKAKEKAKKAKLKEKAKRKKEKEVAKKNAKVAKENKKTEKKNAKAVRKQENEMARQLREAEKERIRKGIPKSSIRAGKFLSDLEAKQKAIQKKLEKVNRQVEKMGDVPEEDEPAVPGGDGAAGPSTVAPAAQEPAAAAVQGEGTKGGSGGGGGEEGGENDEATQAAKKGSGLDGVRGAVCGPRPKKRVVDPRVLQKSLQDRVANLEASIRLLRSKDPEELITRQLPVVDGFSVGDTAIIQGLLESTDLNGIRCLVQSFNEDGADVVTLENDDGYPGGELLTLSTDKIQLLNDE